MTTCRSYDHTVLYLVVFLQVLALVVAERVPADCATFTFPSDASPAPTREICYSGETRSPTEVDNCSLCQSYYPKAVPNILPEKWGDTAPLVQHSCATDSETADCCKLSPESNKCIVEKTDADGFQKPCSNCGDVNGELFFKGNYWMKYNFNHENSKGVTTEVRWQHTGVCDVFADTKKCKSCSLCSEPDGNATSGIVSADCTNVDKGRVVECEPVAPVFFPFVPEVVPACTDYIFPVTEGVTAETREICFSLNIEDDEKSLKSVTYEFVNDLRGLEFKVEMPGEKSETCQVTIGSNETCSTCNICRNPDQISISADCTNLRGGRNVECESILPAFFPLVSTFQVNPPTCFIAQVWEDGSDTSKLEPGNCTCHDSCGTCG